MFLHTLKIIRKLKKKKNDAFKSPYKKSTYAVMLQLLGRLSYASFPLHGMTRLDLLGTVVLLVFHWQKLWMLPGTRCFFWYRLVWGSKQAELILNSGGTTQQTTDWSERIVTWVTKSFQIRLKYPKLCCYISAVLCLAAFSVLWNKVCLLSMKTSHTLRIRNVIPCYILHCSSMVPVFVSHSVKNPAYINSVCSR